MSRPQRIFFSFDDEDIWELYKTLVNSHGNDLTWERSRQDFMERIGQSIFVLEEVPRRGHGSRKSS